MSNHKLDFKIIKYSFIRFLLTISLNIRPGFTTQSPDNLIHISNFLHHTGTYYKFQEHIKLINSNWSLINFINISH